MKTQLHSLGRIRHGSTAIGTIAVMTIGMFAALGQFTPGSGGSIPDIPPLEGEANRISGFMVVKSDRENNVFFSGTRAVIDMSFPPPSTYGASGYQLQRADPGGSNWSNYLTTGSDSQDNFSFNPDGAYQYRLVVQGGAKNGYLSNMVTGIPSSVDTRFSQWGLDESMFISGVMWPWVGRGLTASFTANRLSDDSEVIGGLTYQWYRVNPFTSEMTIIPGATSLTYITTESDLGGYQLLCRATGNGSTVGGHVQVMSSGGVLVPNKSYYSGLATNGFNLHLFKSVPSLTPEDLKLTYWAGATERQVPILSVTAVDGNASFRIGANLPTNVHQFTLSNQSPVWSLGSATGPEHFMQSLQITVPNEGFAPEIAVQAPGGGELTDGSGSTNLGSLLVGTQGPSQTITIRNAGSADLTGLAVTKDGTHAGDFLTSGLSSPIITPGGTATFTIAFKPGAAGARNASIHIASNDSDENPFDIALTGSGIAPLPEIVVQEPKGKSLVEGRTTRNFGTVKIGTRGVSKVFTIKNTGKAPLQGISVKKGGAHVEDFIIISPLKTKLAPGASTTFRVTFKPKLKGTRKAWLKIRSNDGDENPFDIVLTGRATR